jgi:hypothetical protein
MAVKNITEISPPNLAVDKALSYSLQTSENIITTLLKLPSKQAP